jgi:hypothetical protein
MNAPPETDDVMTQWIIYFNPSDYPGKYVVRGHDIVRGQLEPVARPHCFVCESLEEARERLLLAWPGLVCLARHPSDPLPVVEVWL